MTLVGYADHIERVRAANPIEAVIGERVEIGPDRMAICPFHQEKTASLHVHATREFFHCFGCHTGGDVFRFIQLYENFDFRNALRFLESRANIAPYRPTAVEVGVVDEAQATAEVTEALCAFYAQALTSAEGEAARTYLTTQRGLPATFIDQYRLGFGTRGAIPFLETLSPGLAEAAVTAGLAFRVPGATGAFPYRDRLRDRLIFPVEKDGRAIFLSGRATLPGQEPKYLHQRGREAPLYLVEHVNRERVFVTEGALDALSLAAWGYPAVALQGGMRASAIDPLRTVRDLIGVFDADAAGLKSALVMATAFANIDKVRLRFVALPTGMDPNDVYRTHDRQTFEGLVAHAVDIVNYVIQTLPRDLTKVQTATALDPVFRYLAVLPPFDSEMYLNSVLQTVYNLSRAEMGAARQTVTQYRERLSVQCPACHTMLVRR
jgi:DNA primase